MNTNLLFRLYEIHSPSGRERKMRKFLKRQVFKYGASWVQDEHGNLLVTKGASDSYPCLASHMDQVQQKHSRDFRCITGDDVVFGYSPKCHEQQGLGADDKNGIFICLECLRKYDVLKVAFFVGEESGCVGSSKVDLSFFSDCRYIIEPDRRGSRDLITEMFCGDVCSDDFVHAIGANRYGYKKERGSITDVGELVERGVGISCLNLSCGYYEAHTDREFTVLSELSNCLDFVCDIIENVTDTYPYEYDKYSYYKGYGGGGYLYSGFSRDGYYEDGGYDMDFETMSRIIMEEPGITFEKILTDHFMSFWSYDEKELRNVYEDCVACMEGDSQEKWWEEDDAPDYYAAS